MMNKINTLILAALFVSGLVFGQERFYDERSVYSVDNIYPQLINPGAFGFQDGHQVLLDYRNTWSSFEGTPKTITFGYHGRVHDRLGAGLVLFRDTYGALQTSKALLGGSYTIDSPTNRITMGLSGEYVVHNLVSGDGIDSDDALVAKRLDGSSFFDLSFGAHGSYNDNIIYGVVLPGLVSSRLSGDTSSRADTKRSFGFIGQLGYKHRFDEYGMTLTPMITYKSLMKTPTIIRFDVNASFLQDRLIGGLSYTAGGENTIGFLVGTKVEGLNLYYGYQAGRDDFQAFNNGSHNLTVGYTFAGATMVDKK